jgi:homoserine kinase
MPDAVAVSTSASSGNLGPGFDYVGMALDLRTTATALAADKWNVTSPDPSGIIQQAAAAISDTPLQIEITSNIPMGKGLGSSAACITATMGAAMLATGQEIDLDRIMAAGFEMEGHYDNVAAAVYGGIVVCSPQGKVLQLQVHESLRILLALPDETLSTQQARLALPGDISLGAAARTTARAIFLTEGLRTGDVGLLREVGQDELHEPHRIKMRPIIGKVITAARSAGAGAAAMSGAGPAVLAFVDADNQQSVADSMLKALGGAGEILEPGLGAGLKVESGG